MKNRILLAPMMALSALSLSACADNYAVEGAGLGAAAGAGLAAVTDGDFETYALAGAAIGGVIGYARDRNNDCDGYYGDGRYIDDDCRDDDRYRRYW